ncbi:MAG: hypothetical protein ACR2J6_01130 [Thermoleophilaceae bacterium]
MSMAPCALNRLLRSRRRQLIVIAATLCLSGAVAVHHVSTDHGMGMAGAAVVCLAVIPVLAVAMATSALPVLPRLRRFSGAPPEPLPAPHEPRARPSPLDTVVLRL